MWLNTLNTHEPVDESQSVTGTGSWVTGTQSWVTGTRSWVTGTVCVGPSVARLSQSVLHLPSNHLQQNRLLLPFLLHLRLRLL